MVIVCILLGNSPASEFYVPERRFRTFCPFHLHRQVGMKNDGIEQRWANFFRSGAKKKKILAGHNDLL